MMEEFYSKNVAKKVKRQTPSAVKNPDGGWGKLKEATTTLQLTAVGVNRNPFDNLKVYLKSVAKEVKRQTPSAVENPDDGWVK
ncbi:MAG: hypothetical protein WDM90_02160 [Ferruginibacter sp.]